MSDALKDKKGYFIDNEYTNDCDTEDDIKCNSKGKGVRPDIIFHDRKKSNLFVIEMKKVMWVVMRERRWIICGRIHNTIKKDTVYMI